MNYFPGACNANRIFRLETEQIVKGECVAGLMLLSRREDLDCRGRRENIGTALLLTWRYPFGATSFWNGRSGRGLLLSSLPSVQEELVLGPA